MTDGEYNLYLCQEMSVSVLRIQRVDSMSSEDEHSSQRIVKHGLSVPDTHRDEALYTSEQLTLVHIQTLRYLILQEVLLLHFIVMEMSVSVLRILRRSSMSQE